MGRVPLSDKEEFPETGNVDFSDLKLKYHVGEALVAVKSGDRENYEELVGYLQPKKNLNPDEAALLVTTLKVLSEAVSYIDSVHHESLLFAVSSMSLWDYATDVMDALLELIINLAVSNGYVDWCLEMLVIHFVPPPYFSDRLKHANGVDKKNKVLSRVHAALKQIADLVSYSPFRLSPIVVERMPKVSSKELGSSICTSNKREIVMYVENMLRLESAALGEIVGGTMLAALVDRLIELDVGIGWDGILQEDATGLFEMELEDVAEFANEDEEYDMSAMEMFNRNNIQGNLVAENLDSLMVLIFLHLESCQSSGRLPEVFNVLLTSFWRTVLGAYKSKFTQFVMFYACALDPEGCGVKFPMDLADMFSRNVKPEPDITRVSAVAYLASYLSRAKFLSAGFVASIIQRLVDWCFDYCKEHDFDMNPQAHQVFYSGCQAIMYAMCFRMRSLMDVPRLKLQLLNMPMELILKHKLSPLKVCLPTIVEEFLRQAKAARLFITSESFAFNDLLESDLSKAFGGVDRLDMFFPFDPCLLKKSESYIKPHFVRWSRVRTTYDTDHTDEFSDSGSEESDDDFVDRNAKDMIDDDVMMSIETGLGFDSNLNKMSITPKSLKCGHETQLERCMPMPARIRPSTSPESLW